MNINVIAIGSELLEGVTVNSNAAYISFELIKAGLKTSSHCTIPDDPLIIQKTTEASFTKNHVTIVTGGLGPTCDDITLDAIKDVLPIEDGITLKNHLGSASGLFFERNKKLLFFLPGVPQEMMAMFQEFVLPEIVKSSVCPKIMSHWMHFSLLAEKDLDPYLRRYQARFSHLDFGIYPFPGKISIRISGLIDSQKDIESIFDELKKDFKKNFYQSASGSLEEAIHHLFIKKQLTLSTAESCTGGAIAARLTSLAGASQYFSTAQVTYSNEMKMRFLGVLPQTLKTYGAVSKNTVLEMVDGLLERSSTDYGVALSGIAGPSGGGFEKPVGTVWIAIKGKSVAPLVWKMQITGNRQMVIDYSVNAALGKLYHLVLQ